MTEDNTPRYIAVEGAIGAGKTTLAVEIATRIGAQAVLEEFEENPFLAHFYQDQKQLAFQTQIFFLLSRYRQQREILQPDLFYERWTSDYIFARDRIFASINLSEAEMKLYDEIEQTLNREIPLPDVVIYLQAGVPALLENIQKRGRPFEKQISREYLHDVVEAYNHYFYHYRATRLIVVDANRIDFVEHPEYVDLVLAAIYREPHPPVEYISVVPPPFFSV